MSNPSIRVLVTGASGFVGGALCAHLRSHPNMRVRAAVRTATHQVLGTDDPAQVLVSALDAGTDWTDALDGIDVVVHCAARVHVMKESVRDPMAEFRRVNVEGTLQLARQAQAAGVKRFVLVSSIKVNGESTLPGRPFLADDLPHPADPYGLSKLEAEQGLLRLAKDDAMEVVIVRPVLVYGPGVKANFLAMMRWLDRGIPVPLGAIVHNRRSMVAIANLVDLLTTCMVHPAAAGQVFLAADGEDLSTTELLRRVAKALDRPARLLPLPYTWLEAAARMLGRPGVAQRLCGSLQADITKNRTVLGWSPTISVDAALARTAAHYRRDT
ncbi:SDR family oxidoreductase [Herbaspirillum sp. YR522]|uniref:UDP-glucose 4-epimerase family protein n=1 Tax=Herbaspirillum sp. YR522 TaxID=1144342 RepID=UPI00026F889C|nr:SDR family oxidoreductase [Herbaspirillum sp. YR522]EJN00850.1 nucleoside-diphosphate-sugar epimerase [Herbaspirillum sp. YR522]